MSSSLDDMYREIILDHYRAPRGKKPLEHIDFSSEGHNPSCGDEIGLHVEMENGVLKDVHVDCRGCAISVASGSMLAETVKGISFEEVVKIADKVKQLLKGEGIDVEKDLAELGDLSALQGVRNFPVRVKCALLAWVTLVDGLRKFGEGRTDSKPISTESDQE